jgi:hypothetical protein
MDISLALATIIESLSPADEFSSLLWDHFTGSSIMEANFGDKSLPLIAIATMIPAHARKTLRCSAFKRLIACIVRTISKVSAVATQGPRLSVPRKTYIPAVTDAMPENKIAIRLQDDKLP